jgi:hypothetical protein
MVLPLVLIKRDDPPPLRMFATAEAFPFSAILPTLARPAVARADLAMVRPSIMNPPVEKRKA